MPFHTLYVITCTEIIINVEETIAVFIHWQKSKPKNYIPTWLYLKMSKHIIPPVLVDK